ncbi:hypothetical protein OM427_31005, partial [Halomonas sp. 18H]
SPFMRYDKATTPCAKVSSNHTTPSQATRTTMATSTPAFNEKQALKHLSTAVVFLDETYTLPAKKLVGRDRASAKKDLRKIMHSISEAMEIEDINDLKKQYQKIEKYIEEEKEKKSELSRKKRFAKEHETSTLSGLVPTETLKNWTARTKGDFQILIERCEDEIESHENELAKIREELSVLLSDQGGHISPEHLEIWLSSTIKDELLGMAILFDGAKTITEHLKVLTEESGEDLKSAKKYYGMVVILHELIISMQEKLIEKIEGEVLPKLKEQKNEAQLNIKESENLQKEGHQKEKLQKNAGSNKITIQSIDYYYEFIRQSKESVKQALSLSIKERNVARNTYKTVKTSYNVSSLIHDQAITFETLGNIMMPEVPDFQNKNMRENLREISKEITS